MAREGRGKSERGKGGEGGGGERLGEREGERGEDDLVGGLSEGKEGRKGRGWEKGGREERGVSEKKEKCFVSRQKLVLWS